MFCLPGGALCAPASMRTATVHPAKKCGEKVLQNRPVSAKPNLAVALNDRRFCSSDSWLQRGNICLKTCTAFTAGFMPEMADVGVKILATSVLMAGSRGVWAGLWKKYIWISIRCDFLPSGGKNENYADTID